MVFSASLCAIAALPAAARGQTAETASWHIIRPGDTLDGILARYYGSSAAAAGNETPSATETVRAEGLRLNPQVVDPNLIYPGRRLRLSIEPEDVRLPVARLESIGARVEELPRPVSWIAALEGDLLLEGDGVRTYGARVAFDRAFNVPPVVQIGITGFDIDNKDNARLNVGITNVDVTGFDVELRTWLHTRIWSVDLNWFAIGH